MIEIIPWMLILVLWHPDEPDAFDIRRQPRLFANVEDCRAAGANQVAGSEIYERENAGTKVSYRCVPVPESAEYNALYAQIEDARRQEVTPMHKKPDPTAGEGQ